MFSSDIQVFVSSLRNVPESERAGVICDSDPSFPEDAFATKALCSQQLPIIEKIR